MTFYRGLDITEAEDLVQAERRRQFVIGYTPDRDHGKGLELMQAGRAYLHQTEALWPWGKNFWRPKTRIHDYLRAAALFLAAQAATPGRIEHLDRSITHTTWLLQRELNSADQIRSLIS